MPTCIPCLEHCYIAAHHTPAACRRKWMALKADSMLAPSQWETALRCNDVSHWLGANIKSALALDEIRHIVVTTLSPWWRSIWNCCQHTNYLFWHFDHSSMAKFSPDKISPAFFFYYQTLFFLNCQNVSNAIRIWQSRPLVVWLDIFQGWFTGEALWITETYCDSIWDQFDQQRDRYVISLADSKCFPLCNTNHDNFELMLAESCPVTMIWH